MDSYQGTEEVCNLEINNKNINIMILINNKISIFNNRKPLVLKK